MELTITPRLINRVEEGELWDWVCFAINTANNLYELEINQLEDLKKMRDFDEYLSLSSEALSATESFAIIANDLFPSMDDLECNILICEDVYDRLSDWVFSNHSIPDKIQVDLRRLTKSLHSIFRENLRSFL